MEAVFADHNRVFEGMRFVYPVISRRARGLSLGINLDYDKTCNFDCPYCQVNRRVLPSDAFDFEVLQQELSQALKCMDSGKIFTLPRFAKTPPEFQVFRDIAIAGDGEPSVNPWLLPTMDLLWKLSASHTIPKVTLITNATGLHREKTQKALQILNRFNGEVWAKLDAGTQSYFETVSGTSKRLDSIQKRILAVPVDTRLVLQCCFMRIHGEAPKPDEIRAWRQRVEQIHSAHPLQAVQVYTIARQPAQSYVHPLKLAEMEALFETERPAGLRFDFYAGAAD